MTEIWIALAIIGASAILYPFTAKILRARLQMQADILSGKYLAPDQYSCGPADHVEILKRRYGDYQPASNFYIADDLVEIAANCARFHIPFTYMGTEWTVLKVQSGKCGLNQVSAVMYDPRDYDWE